jgi:hypothetical protein
MVPNWLFVNSYCLHSTHVIQIDVVEDWYSNVVVVNSFPRWFFDNLNEIKSSDNFEPFIINFLVLIAVFSSFFIIEIKITQKWVNFSLEENQ